MKTQTLRTVLHAGLLLAFSLPAAVHGQDARVRAQAVTRVAPDAAALITKKELVSNRRLTLKGWSGDISEARISDLAGNDISEILKPKNEGGSVTMALPTRPFVVKTRTPQTVNLSGLSETMLPGGLVLAPSSPATAGGPATAVWFRLFCSISPRPAPWNESEGRYVTTLKFTVRPTEGSPAGTTLPFPVAVSLEFDGMTAQDVPAFTITESGLEHQKVIELRFRPSTTQPKLKVRSTISDSDVAIDALPRLELRPARSVLLGFGLETVTVAVAQVQADGQPATATTPATVDVQVRGAARREGTAEVVIAAGAARTEFVLRSSGLGKVTIQATAGAQSATTELNQRFPFGPLVATLFGGALGGLARRWVKGARPRPLLRNVLEGTVVGLVAFVAAILGVGYLDLPPAIAATEAGAFLTAILCGFAGITVFSFLTAKLKPGTGT